jgi:hypothetical protein
MAAVNSRRVALGAVVAGVVWTVWTMVVNTLILGGRYAWAQEQGILAKAPRYPYFLPVWIVALFAISFGIAWLYASARATRGAGPATALTIGVVVGFAAGFPGNWATLNWAGVGRAFPFWWMLDLWVGAILAALVAGWLYRD